MIRTAVLLLLVATRGSSFSRVPSLKSTQAAPQLRSLCPTGRHPAGRRLAAPIGGAEDDLSAPARLRALLERDPTELLLMPCCYDALTARAVERAGFEVTFMTGYGVAATHGVPDAQLLGYGEMQAAAARLVGGGVSRPLAIPCIGNGDTGYGNALNVKRTVRGYAQVQAETETLP